MFEAELRTHVGACQHALGVGPLILFLLALACIASPEPTDESEQQSRERAVTSVEIQPDSMTLQLGDVGRATCYPRNEFGTLLTNPCNWVSRDTFLVRTTTSTQTS